MAKIQPKPKKQLELFDANLNPHPQFSKQAIKEYSGWDEAKKVLFFEGKVRYGGLDFAYEPRGLRHQLKISKEGREICLFSAKHDLETTRKDAERVVAGGFSLQKKRFVDLQLSVGDMPSDNQLIEAIDNSLKALCQKVLNPDEPEKAKPIVIAAYEEEKKDEKRTKLLTEMGFQLIDEERVNPSLPDYSISVILAKNYSSRKKKPR